MTVINLILWEIDPETEVQSVRDVIRVRWTNPFHEDRKLRPEVARYLRRLTYDYVSCVWETAIDQETIIA